MDVGFAGLADGDLDAGDGLAVGVGDASGDDASGRGGELVLLERLAVDVLVVDVDAGIPVLSGTAHPGFLEVVPAVGAAAPAHVEVVVPAAVDAAIAIEDDGVSGVARCGF